MNSDLTPRPTACPRSWRLRRALQAAAALSLAGSLSALAIDLQQGAVVTLQGFKTQGRAENGARWRLQGDSAVIRGTVYELTGVTVDLDLEDGRTAKITSRACVYHQDSGLVESQDAVHVESGGSTLDGVGFDMLMSERRLRIRDAVRMELPAAGGARLNALGLPSAGGPAPAPNPPDAGQQGPK